MKLARGCVAQHIRGPVGSTGTVCLEVPRLLQAPPGERGSSPDLPEPSWFRYRLSSQEDAVSRAAAGKRWKLGTCQDPGIQSLKGDEADGETEAGEATGSA